MHISGIAYAPRSSVRCEAQLDLSVDKYVYLNIDSGTQSCESAELQISQSVGNLPIRITFPNGWTFVASRTEALDAWLKNNGQSSRVDKLERNWSAWLVGSVVTLLVLFASYTYLLPWVSFQVAKSLPPTLVSTLQSEVINTLDEQSFQPSKLPASQQQAIRARAQQYIAKLDPLPYPIQIEFRSSKLGANAFALPGGMIILLDELVNMAENDQQLDSIILHEVGHVYHRHMTTRLVHSSILSVSFALLTGESTGIVDNLAGIALFILANGESRQAEREADLYAKQAMIEIYGSSQAMAEMFVQLQQHNQTSMPKWLSSHPDIEQRISAASSSY
ncbi:M48 family metallopeptidase [Vibrio sp. SCSIO 43136]|uniref:M48 family metallopeptidase n=1 Tax=Vibrio sp. SCSIO 43136 TaxID=2819101 RepID=UPI0020755158|nr:M48 family metallopeptidase [Vibrio sp. SCSIO 43136]USD65585.1 M48 family metallopeptidase [Vibrio sp. SCSIO 43136]